jgi:hypothetical protein
MDFKGPVIPLQVRIDVTAPLEVVVVRKATDGTDRWFNQVACSEGRILKWCTSVLKVNRKAVVWFIAAGRADWLFVDAIALSLWTG